MSQSSSTSTGCGGCLGCLGTLVILTFVGSMFFGGGFLMRVGSLSFALGGDPIDRKQIINNYWTDLESSKKVAEEAVKQFHTQIEQGKCQDIYNQANEVFKNSLTQSQLINVCTELKRQFGTVNSEELTNWWVQPTNEDSDSYILLRYITLFSKSSVRETFVWVVKGSKAELINYEIFPQSAVIQSPSPSPSTSPSPSASQGERI